MGPSGTEGIRVWSDYDAFQASSSTLSATCVTVAGVGSSALGAAAFARNVADAIGEPVLTVVSGYGLADLATETLGGFFLFGYINSVRHLFEPLDDATRPLRHSIDTSNASLIDVLRKSHDVRTLTALLRRHDVRLLVGHSKGNLVISEALTTVEEVDSARSRSLAENGRIIAISAKVAMPRRWSNVTDVIGSIDGFGWLNSRPRIKTDVSVAGKWHHTNTELPFSLPVTKTVRSIVQTA